jgi:hypothetical protein
MSSTIASKRRKIERARKIKGIHFFFDFAPMGYDFRAKLRA